MSKPAHTIGNVRADIPPRCGMDRVEIQITAAGLLALPVTVLATVAVLGWGDVLLAALHNALRGL